MKLLRLASLMALALCCLATNAEAGLRGLLRGACGGVPSCCATPSYSGGWCSETTCCDSFTGDCCDTYTPINAGCSGCESYAAPAADYPSAYSPGCSPSYSSHDSIVPYEGSITPYAGEMYHSQSTPPYAPGVVQPIEPSDPYYNDAAPVVPNTDEAIPAEEDAPEEAPAADLPAAPEAGTEDATEEGAEEATDDTAYRTYRSRRGRIRVVCRLDRFDPRSGEVTLVRKRDGKELTGKITDLHGDDQAFIRQLVGEVPSDLAVGD